MAVIDDKVVAMSFESSKFESGVNNTISALDKLKAALHLPTASRGLDDVAKAAKRIDLSHIGRGVDAIQQKLSYFSVAALSIFANIATGAVQAGARIVKSFTLEPVITGYREYATNLNAIQTILANTQASGATLKDVNAALLQLNIYSDKTIYNFSQMAKNIGTFTAAGVDLDTAVGSIKGIANLAALSGSSADQASTAMYQLSQAIAAGRVGLQDWNSVVNAGMGGTVFQRALAQTAEAMGTLKEGTVKLVGPMKNVSINGESFRQSMQAAPGKTSWLTSGVLTSTLKQFNGDLKDSELAAQGFNEQQIKAIQQTAQTAMHAATEVKTLTQVLDVAKETAGSGWAQTWQIIFGDFGEAKTTFTALSNAINGFINANAKARNKVLADWKALGGRTILINSIKTAFQNLGAILAPIKDAFRDIFPAATGRDLLNLTLRFRDFANALKPSAETIDNLRRTFRGVFAVLDIGKQIVSGIITVFAELFKTAGGGSGGFLNLTGSIGDFLVSVDEALKKGNRLHNFFVSLGHILAAPVQMLRAFAGVIGNLFSGFSAGGVSSQLSGISGIMMSLETVATNLAEAWDNLIDSLKSTVDAQSVVESLSQAIQGIGTAIGTAASNINFEAVLAVIRTGLFAGLVLMFKQFLGRGSFLDQVTKGFGTGIIGNISSAFGSLSGSMKAMQNNIKAKTLKEIAIAIALLAASLFLISLIDPKKLNSSLGAMTVMFGELIGAMALLDKIATSGGFLKLPIIVAGLIGLAIAIDLLTISVLALSRLSWNDLLKGLAGVGGLLLGISVAIKPLSAGSAGIVRAGVGIIGIAIAIKLLASAVADFATMSWQQMARGLVGVGTGLLIIANAVKIMPKSMIITGAGLVVLATGLKILAGAVTQFGNMDWKVMAKGLGGIGAALIVIGAAMRLMPNTLILTAAGLAIVALSLNKIADAVVKMGGMSIKQIAKGLGTLAGSLLILAVALHAMSGTLGGAAALALAATGIALLAPALALLGKQSWGSILKSLVTLGLALTVLGIAGVALSPTIPALLGLGAALVLIGGGLALAGTGIFLISAGISALAVSGPTGIAILMTALSQFYKTIPELAKNVVLGLLEIVNGISKTAPAFLEAIVKVINILLDAIIKSAPKMATAFVAILDAGLSILAARQNEIIQAGLNLLLALLQGIRKNIAQVTTAVVDIVVTFLRSLASNLGRIITAGAQLLISLLQGISNNVAKISAAALDIITKFISTIVTNLVKVIAVGVNIVASLITGIAKNYVKLLAAGTDAIITFVSGVEKAGGRIIVAAVDAAGRFITTLASQIVKLSDKVFTALITLINGMAATINRRSPELQAAGLNLGYAIINGMTFGIAGKAQDLYNTISGVVSKAKSLLHVPFKVHSPSEVTQDLGESIIDGLVIGLKANANGAYAAAEALSNGVINAFNTTFQTASPSKVMIQIGQYVGQGFAQGLRGSQDDIRAAFTELNGKLTEAMADARETIDSEEKKLAELRKAKKPDTDAIKEAQKVIDENEALLRRSTVTRQALVLTLKDEKKELIGLTGEYEKISEKLKMAQDALDQARQTRNDAIKSFSDQYSTLPDIVTTDAEGNSIDALAHYMEALKNQTDAVSAYQATLQQLRKLGLDDDTYQKLLKEGTVDQQFATQLLSGGKDAVQALNKLDANLDATSKRLGNNAAKNLYQAGVDAAEGLVKGLTSKKSAIRQAIEDIADEILSTLRRKLQIKSPSKIFEEIGSYAMEGMAIGFSKSSNLVRTAIEDAAKDAISTMKRSIGNMSSVIANEIDSNPVITPILDLTQLRSQSEELAGLTKVVPISAAASFGQATMISSEQTAAQTEELSAGTSPTVKFEQNNYSPTALTEIEIYRNTKNQLSQLKSVLAVT